MFLPMGALNFVLSLFVKDVGLPDDNAAGKEQHPGENIEEIARKSEPEGTELDHNIPEAIPGGLSEKGGERSVEKSA
jgi:hypothetical protein